MRRELGQVGELIRAFLAVRPYLKWILLVSLIIGIGAGVYVRMASKPSYVSEAIAMIRPQQPIELKQTKEDQEQSARWSMLPKPLSVNDYVFLLKSDGILGAVAAAYNTYHPQADSAKELRITALARMLNVESRLELKTPYTVSYHPTMRLRATASSRETAHELASIWLKVAMERTHEITFAAKEEALRYLDREYDESQQAIDALAQRINAVKDENAERIEAVAGEQSGIEKTVAVETIRRAQKAGDTWDRDIAVKSSEFNLPLIEAQIEAKTEELERIQQARNEKTRELSAARARIGKLGKEMAQFHAAESTSPGGQAKELLWTLDLKEEKKEEEESSSSEKKPFASLTLPSEGLSPVAVLLAQEISSARVLVEALPTEIGELSQTAAAQEADIENMQARFFQNQATLDIMERAKESEVESIEKAGEYELKDAERRGEVEVDKITRACTAIEEQLQLDLDTQKAMFESLAENRLRARLAVANLIDEFQVVSTPTFPEEELGISFVLVAGGVFVAAALALTTAALLLVVLREVVEQVQANIYGTSNQE